MINDIDRELECKLTSGSGSRGGSRSYSLQTDWATLKKKGQLDYLYFIVNDTFDKFCVLFFEDLTSDDFYPPAKGSRGKSRMNKKNAMKKAKALHGDFSCVNVRMIKLYESRISSLLEKSDEEVTDQLSRLIDKNDTVENAEKIISKVEEKYEKKIKKFQEKIRYWQDTDEKYTICLSKVD